MKPEDQDRYLQAAVIAVVMLFLTACLLSLSKSAHAAPGHGSTECTEWASMVQILVLRWQGQNLPKPDGTQANNEDVKNQLKLTMKGHPELDYALTWVDYAWKRKDENPVHVWVAAKAQCEGGTI